MKQNDMKSSKYRFGPGRSIQDALRLVSQGMYWKFGKH
ncbi:hypothetical protein MGWOODY_Mmi1726 [hydrothermal vent metagenome]|uniref:Uncharacterized protein n=1 Tax=hydrothermal vent metagenome TaxID=652676 RepID=A0A160VHF8_9ZZZZ